MDVNVTEIFNIIKYFVPNLKDNNVKYLYR